MTKEQKGKKKSRHESRYQHTFIKRKIEQEEPIGNDNMATSIGKKRKS